MQLSYKKRPDDELLGWNRALGPKTDLLAIRRLPMWVTTYAFLRAYRALLVVNKTRTLKGSYGQIVNFKVIKMHDMI